MYIEALVLMRTERCSMFIRSLHAAKNNDRGKARH